MGFSKDESINFDTFLLRDIQGYNYKCYFEMNFKEFSTYKEDITHLTYVLEK